jgi:hypothetical protein
MLDLAPSMFCGRVLPCDIPEVIRWEIETKVEGHTIEPTTETVVYSRMYPGWEIGVVTQHTTACCSMQVVDIILVKYHFTNITSLRVVQQKHSGLYSST